MEFTKKDTMAMKGIAIIMMIIHHCFFETSRYEGYNIVFAPLNERYTVIIASFFKICVGIFVFLSGFGITKSIIKISNGRLADKQTLKKVVFKRYIALMFGFIFVFILSQLFCWFANKGQIEIYKSNNIFNSISYFIADGLGLANLFGTPTLNGTWWYMSLAIIIVVITPLLYNLIKKYGLIITLALNIFITQVLKVDKYDITRWMTILIFGIYSANTSLLTQIKNCYTNTIFKKIIKFIIYTALLVGAIVFREKLNYTFLEIRDGLIPMIFIGYCYEFILPIKYVTNILQFLGKHSMNIFLTHTFIRYYYFKDFTYSFKYSILIVLVLLGISIIVSMVIELLKKAIKYNEFIEFLKQKVDRKIDKNNEIREK